MQSTTYIPYESNNIFQAVQKPEYIYGLSMNRVKSVYSERNVVKEKGIIWSTKKFKKVGLLFNVINFSNEDIYLKPKKTMEINGKLITILNHILCCLVKVGTIE